MALGLSNELAVALNTPPADDVVKVDGLRIVAALYPHWRTRRASNPGVLAVRPSASTVSLASIGRAVVIAATPSRCPPAGSTPAAAGRSAL